jgi:hypothetical protein
MSLNKITGYHESSAMPQRVRDVLGRLKVSIHQNIYEADFEYGPQPLRWEIYTNNVSGLCNVQSVPSSGGVRLRLGTSPGDCTIRQSRPYHRYQPGKTMFMATGCTLGTALAGNIQRVGFFDDSNGVFFEQSVGYPTNPYGIYVVVRTDVGGVIQETRIGLDQWNGDQQNINQLNFNNIQMMWIEYGWYGAGATRWGFWINGEPVIAHQIGWANYANPLTNNNQSTPWSRTGNLPVRYEQRNTSGTSTANDFYHYGVSVIIEGQQDGQRGFTYSYGMPLGAPTRAIPSGSTRFPLLSIRSRAMGTQEFGNINGLGNGGNITAATVYSGNAVGSISGTTLTITNINAGSITTGSAITGTGIIWGTFIITQLTSTSTAIATTTASAASGATSVTVTSATGIAANQLITAVGIPAGTFVSASYVSGTTVGLVDKFGISVATTALLSTTAISFYTPNGIGTYSVSVNHLAPATTPIYANTLQLSISAAASNTAFSLPPQTLTGTITIAVGGQVTLGTSLSQPLQVGTPLVLTGTATYIANGTYYVATSPAPTVSVFYLVTTQGGSTPVTTTAGVSAQTFTYYTTYNLITSGTQTGLFAVGDTISGTGIQTGATILAITGTSPNFTIQMSLLPSGAASGTVTAAMAVNQYQGRGIYMPGLGTNGSGQIGRIMTNSSTTVYVSDYVIGAAPSGGALIAPSVITVTQTATASGGSVLYNGSSTSTINGYTVGATGSQIIQFANTTGIQYGQSISGVGVAAGTTVTSVASNSYITVSIALVANITATTYSFVQGYVIGLANRGQLLPKTMFISSDKLCVVELIAGSISNTATLISPAWTALNQLGSAYSFAERDTTATSMSTLIPAVVPGVSATGGEVVFAFVSPQGGSGLQLVDLSFFFAMYNSIRGNQVDTLTIAITNNSGFTANVAAHLIAQEAMS